MSAATELFAPGFDGDFEDEFAPVVPRRHLSAVPARVPVREVARPVREARDASVSVLLPPERERPPVRLTRRGVVVLALAVAAFGAVLVWLAALSSPAGGEAASGGAASTPAVVTVGAGDTLWSIASRVAPNADPRATVDHLRELNHLDSVALVPGQQVRVR